MSKDTKTRLLDAAEALYAANGIAATSVRQITDEAEANVASVSFHFGGKSGLTRAVFLRRLEPLTNARLARLVDVKAAGTPDLASLLNAFVDPLLDLAGQGRGQKRFLQLFGRTLTDPTPEIGEIFTTDLRDYTLAFFEAMHECLPYLSKDELAHRLNFVVGALGHTLSDPVRRDLSHALSALDNTPNNQDVIAHLKAFALAGLQAPARKPAA
jgi:AcrR family transcriptional regulator